MNCDRAIQNSTLCRVVAEDADVDLLISTYDDVLRDITDRFAPLHVSLLIVARRGSKAGDCRSERRDCRRRY